MKKSYIVFLMVACGAGSLFAQAPAKTANPTTSPNVVFILTDQQSATMMSCTGNPWLKTPAMDYIAANGIRFERAYSANPVCSPARVSFMTGRFPGSFDTKRKGRVRENSGAMSIAELPGEVKRTHLAAHLKKAGYGLYYGGKTHLPKPLSPKTLGFETIAKNSEMELAEACADLFIRKHERPFFLWANFINPHDICYVAIDDVRYEKQRIGKSKLNGAEKTVMETMSLDDRIPEEEFFAKHCPPLPDNHAIQQDEPASITQLVARRSFRRRARENYSEKDWRFHRWIYHRLTERVDREIQVLLDGLKAAGLEKNTIVILTSDHGDHAGAHKMEHKSTCYDEVARVPFLVMHKGTAPGGQVDNTHLVSTGLDLLPTVCDYAGLPAAKADPRGLSLRPLIEGKTLSDWRKTLGVESQVGRMVVGDQVKYIRYDLDGQQEQLLDLKKDPGETRHFTNDPDYADTLRSLRQAFDQTWFPVKNP